MGGRAPPARGAPFGTSAQAGDPVRVTVAGVEVEGRIDAVDASTLHVRVGRRLF